MNSPIHSVQASKVKPKIPCNFGTKDSTNDFKSYLDSVTSCNVTLTCPPTSTPIESTGDRNRWVCRLKPVLNQAPGHHPHLYRSF